ncbi:hypothetical protein EPN15_04940 [Patescibacteria group bacterium]|nr:MAG: hypothetical protein EPN15_04940 [Patescibacteria group bacterium]
MHYSLQKFIRSNCMIMVAMIGVSLFALAAFLAPVSAAEALSIAQKNSGKILLQVESHGEAWYVNPKDLKKYSLGKPADAFAIIKKLGIGISNANLGKIPRNGTKDKGNQAVMNKLKGKIVIQVQGRGEAWYVHPVSGKRYSLGKPAAAFAVIKKLGSGITNANLAKIPTGTLRISLTPTNPVVSQAPSVPQPSQPTNLFNVVSVVDGDTIKVSINGATQTIRLIGIDTPETVDPRNPVQCFGKEASDKAKSVLTGKMMRLESDPTQGDLDKYQRLLRYVFLADGTFFNKMMIADGYAHEYTYNTPYQYQAEFKAAESAARTAQLGLWSLSTCNGDTTNPASPPTQSQSTGKFYTSSYGTAIYYYPEACSEWKSLSPKYLMAFDSLDALLAAYPSRIKSPQCE